MSKSDTSIISQISSLISLLYSNCSNKVLISSFFSNIKTELKKNQKTDYGYINYIYSYDIILEIERNFLMLFQVLDEKIFKNKSSNMDLAAEVLIKLLDISIIFQSLSLYLLLIYKIKELKISYETDLESFSIINNQSIFVNYLPKKCDTIKEFSVPINAFIKNNKPQEFSFIYDSGYIYLVLESGVIHKIGTGYEGTLQNKLYCERAEKSLECEIPRILINSDSLYVLTSTKSEITITQINASNLLIVS